MVWESKVAGFIFFQMYQIHIQQKTLTQHFIRNTVLTEASLCSQEELQGLLTLFMREMPQDAI